MRPEEIAFIVLAAGSSRRFGSENKLLADLDGLPVLAHVLQTLSAFEFMDRIIVVGHDSCRVSDLALGTGFGVVENTDFDRGIGTSIAAGIRGSREARAYLIMLGDMPFVSSETVSRLVASVSGAGQLAICRCGDALSPPALFGRDFRDTLMALTGDEGARKVVRENRDSAIFLEVSSTELTDIDTR